MSLLRSTLARCWDVELFMKFCVRTKWMIPKNYKSVDWFLDGTLAENELRALLELGLWFPFSCALLPYWKYQLFENRLLLPYCHTRSWFIYDCLWFTYFSYFILFSATTNFILIWKIPWLLSKEFKQIKWKLH